MFNLKLLRTKFELKDTLKKREKEFIRLKFDQFHAVKKYRESISRLKELDEKEMKTQEELNLQNQMGGKTTKTKERIIQLENELKSIMKDKQEIEDLKIEIRERGKIIPLAEELIKDLKYCVKNPQKIYDISEKKETNNQR